MPAGATVRPLAFAPGNSERDARGAGSADPLVQVLFIDARRNDERVARLRYSHGVLDGLKSARKGATVIGVAAGLGADVKGHGVFPTSGPRIEAAPTFS